MVVSVAGGELAKREIAAQVEHGDVSRKSRGKGFSRRTQQILNPTSDANCSSKDRREAGLGASVLCKRMAKG